MKKVGILGGTFNPPHLGHLIIANEVRHALGLDEVRLMPTAIPPHKGRPSDATAEQRLAMTEIAVREVQGLTVSSFEVDRGGVSYTYDTMSQLNKLEADCEFYFIVGGDMIDNLSTWYKIDELLKIVKFVGVGRPGTVGQSAFPITMVDSPQINLSSTLIRKRLNNGETVQLLLPKMVEQYIHQEELYEA